MAGLQLEWQWASAGGMTGSTDVIIRPLVVLLPWVWSEPKYVNKYTQLCHQRGWDVLVARWPMLALWFPMWSRVLASQQLAALGKELLSRGPRPVVFWCFSGAAKGLYSSLLRQLADPTGTSPQQAACAAAVLRCAVGQVYDSGPVDFSSDMGRRLLSPDNGNSSSSSSMAQTAGSNGGSSGGSSSASTTGSSDGKATAAAIAAAARSAAQVAVTAGVDVAAGTLDFFLMEWFDRDRDNMWRDLATPLRGPVLMLYSRNDALADASQIASLAATLRCRGLPVLEQVWHDSPHVGHLRAHPQAYNEALSYLLSQALQEWSNRNSRHCEGRDWVLHWQQQEQQCPSSSSSSSSGQHVTCNRSPPMQQQQQLVMQPTHGVFGSSSNRKGSRWWGTSGCGGVGQQRPTLVRSGTSSDPCLTHSSSSSSNGSGSNSHNGVPGLSLAFGAAAAAAGGAEAQQAAAMQAAAAARRAELLAQQLTPWVLASQMAFDSGGSSGGGCSGSNGSSGNSGSSSSGGSSKRGSAVGTSVAAAAAAGAGPAGVVRISSWPATATAVAAALHAGEGCGEPVCADSTLLSHSLRCLASSFVATHLVGSSGSSDGGCGSSGDGCSNSAEQHSAQAPHRRQQQAGKHGAKEQQQQQQQHFMLRMVNRLRSRL